MMMMMIYIYIYIFLLFPENVKYKIEPAKILLMAKPYINQPNI